MTHATLRGADHPQLDEIAAIAEGHAAIALSRGGARKTYPHSEPNEDVCAFALSQWGGVVVVADGHAGCLAAEAATRQVLEAHAPRWLEPAPIALDARFATEATDVAADVNTAILRASTGSGAEASRTTLTVGLLRPGDGWVAALSVGDSHAFLTGDGQCVELAARRGGASLFLGDPSLSREEIEAGVRVERAEIGERCAFVLASDGLSERAIGVGDPPAAVLRAVRGGGAFAAPLRPLETARNVVLEALAAHREHRSGDNAAAAVLWID